MTTAIAVMAKAPRSGHSKTRLIPGLSAEQAARMSAAFLGDVTDNLALAARRCDGAIVPYVAFAPAGAEAEFDGLLAPGTRLLLADGTGPAADGVTGFGRSLLHAVRSLLQRGHDAVCVLNADSPNLPTRLLLAAHTALAAPGDRIVLGPAEDGGYYLLGMKHLHEHLFAHIDWSSGLVAAQTRDRAAEAKIPVVELEMWYDVDEPAALRRLVRDLAGTGPGDTYAAARTARCAAMLGLIQPVDDPVAAAAGDASRTTMGADQ
jgi:rSAM/selenodomain-associated transferase 1